MMTMTDLVLVTGAGRPGGVSQPVIKHLLAAGLGVRAMVHHDDERADAVRALGADVVAGDLTTPRDVVQALDGVGRMFFSMSVSPNYLEAAATVAAIARATANLDVLVDMSQMTVSQMTATSTAESHQQRLHWLSEQVFDWSGLPVVHVRPTAFLDNPLFTTLAGKSIRERDVIELPFGSGHSSPVAVADVARVVATVLRDPSGHIGRVYELTGPRSLDMTELAEQYAEALGRPVSYVDIPLAEWVRRNLTPAGFSDHVAEHITTMARLHRENRYDRMSNDVERLTGERAQSVKTFVAEHRELFG
jgi:uncharacterized protein YbjT (DUF2867 family)